MAKQTLLKVRVDCPFCHHQEYKEITAKEINQKAKAELCPECKRARYIEYAVTSYCSFNRHR